VDHEESYYLIWAPHIGPGRSTIVTRRSMALTRDADFDRNISTWYLTTWIIAWVLSTINFMIIFTIIFRRTIPMRHDTISSYLGSGTDGARLLAVTVTMSTMAVLAVHLLEFEHRSMCGSVANSTWACVLTIVANVSLVVTLVVPGGKYYVAAVKANADVRSQVHQISINTVRAVQQDRDSWQWKYSLQPEKDQLYDTISILETPLTIENPPLVTGNPLSPASTEIPADIVKELEDECDRLRQQIRFLLPADDQYLADGHLIRLGGDLKDLLYGRDTNRRPSQKDPHRFGWWVKVTNQMHNLGVGLWVLMLTPVEVLYISQLWNDWPITAAWGLGCLVAGWMSLLSFQWINVCRITPRFAHGANWSKDFIHLFNTENIVPENCWWMHRGGWDALSPSQKMRVYFRWAVFLEGLAILFISNSSLGTSWGRVNQVHCHNKPS